MRGTKTVELAFRTLGEAGQAPALPQSPDLGAAGSQNLVRVGLMAYIPDQAVARRVEDVVQRDGQFDDAQAGAQVTPCDSNGIDRLRAQFVGHLSKLAFAQLPQVSGGVDGIEQGGC